MITVLPFDGRGFAWDEFVSGAEGSTFCHLAGWREVMADVLGHECRYLVAINGGGRWQGVLPLVRVRSRMFGDYLISLPFLNYGGPLGDAPARTRLAEEAVVLARRLGVDLLELRSRRPFPGNLRVSQRKITVLLPLPPSADLLWARFPSKLRAQVRRAEREGVTVRFGADQVVPFYEVFARHMHELGTPALPRALFERLARLFPHLVEIGALYQGERPIAAGCGFVWRDEFEITWASDLREYRRTAPNMLLYWEFMRRMIARGVRTFNFGRCTPDGSTHRFKRQWGGEDVPLPWAQWSPRAVTATPSPDRPVYRLATAAWRRLPLSLTNTLGPAIARHLP
ncbi:MAG: FemAB family XrtA/PEP-CTERM system-associated protein [Gemmatimonadales bacterium]